jgi:hypothetical protein
MGITKSSKERKCDGTHKNLKEIAIIYYTTKFTHFENFIFWETEDTNIRKYQIYSRFLLLGSRNKRIVVNGSFSDEQIKNPQYICDENILFETFKPRGIYHLASLVRFGMGMRSNLLHKPNTT